LKGQAGVPVHTEMGVIAGITRHRRHYPISPVSRVTFYAVRANQDASMK